MRRGGAIAGISLLAILASSASAPFARAGDEGRALRLRAYFSATDEAGRKRALEALEAIAVPAGLEERAKALREGLAYAKHAANARLDEQLPEKGEGYVCTPRGYDPKRVYPLALSIHGRHGDRHDGIRPFCMPAEEWNELRKPIEDEVKKKGYDLAKVKINPPPVNLPWDGLVAAPTVVDRTEERLPLDRAEMLALALLARANRSCAVDQDRVVLTGISAGAAIVYAIAARHPDRFAGVLGVAGGVFGDTPLENLRRLQVLVVHGDADKAVPVEEGRRSDAMLSEAKVPHVYKEVAGLDHRWPKPGSDETRFVRAWLKERVRTPWPRALEHRFVASEGSRRVFWVELPAGDAVSVVARAQENEVDVESRARSIVLHLGEPLVDLEKEVVVRWEGREVFRGKLARSWKELISDFEGDGFDAPRAAPARIALEHP